MCSVVVNFDREKDEVILTAAVREDSVLLAWYLSSKSAELKIERFLRRVSIES